MQNSKLCNNILKIVDNHNGKTSVEIECTKTGKKFKITQNVEVNNKLLLELQAFIKDDCIKVI